MKLIIIYKVLILFLFLPFPLKLSWANDSNNMVIKVNYSPVANFIYQIDCLSQHVLSCSRKNFKTLWEKKFVRSRLDRTLIKQWALLMGRYSSKLEFEKSKLIFIGRFQEVKLSTKARIASFQSEDLKEYFSRLDLVMTPQDKAQAKRIITHFFPRYMKWWKQEGEKWRMVFAKETETLLRSQKIATKLKQFSHFYEVSLPSGYEIILNLFYRPDLVKENMKGEQIDNYLTVEFSPSDKPIDKTGIVIHELCHFFIENATLKKLSSLKKRFVKYGTVSSIGAYNLLDETLATALGNGLIKKTNYNTEQWQKYLSRERSFYDDYHINRAAKAILPFLGRWLDKGKTLYDGNFVANYVKILNQEFGSELIAPKLILNELVLVTDGQYKKNFSKPVQKAFRVRSMYSSQGSWDDPRLLKTYRRNLRMSAMIIVHPKNIDEIRNKKILNSTHFKSMKEKFQSKSQVVFSTKRSSMFSLFIIIAKDSGRVIQSINQLAGRKEGFSGVMIF